MIVEALENSDRAMTAVELMAELNISKRTLYDSAGDGGLTNLLKRGKVSNRRARGGYFLPDGK